MTNSWLITVKQNDETIYTCAVYGNQYEKILEKIAEKFGGTCYYKLDGWSIECNNDICYDVYIDTIDKIFLS